MPPAVAAERRRPESRRWYLRVHTATPRSCPGHPPLSLAPTITGTGREREGGTRGKDASLCGRTAAPRPGWRSCWMRADFSSSSSKTPWRGRSAAWSSSRWCTCCETRRCGDSSPTRSWTASPAEYVGRAAASAAQLAYFPAAYAHWAGVQDLSPEAVPQLRVVIHAALREANNSQDLVSCIMFFHVAACAVLRAKSGAASTPLWVRMPQAPRPLVETACAAWPPVAWCPSLTGESPHPHRITSASTRYHAPRPSGASRFIAS